MIHYILLIFIGIFTSAFAAGFGLLGGNNNYNSYDYGGAYGTASSGNGYYAKPYYTNTGYAGYPSSIGGGYESVGYYPSSGVSGYGGYGGIGGYGGHGSYGGYGGYSGNRGYDNSYGSYGGYNRPGYNSGYGGYSSGPGYSSGLGGYRTNYLGKPYGYRGYGYSNYKK